MYATAKRPCPDRKGTDRQPGIQLQFREGGAGAYSTASSIPAVKTGNVDKILNVFCQHGASSSILVDAHPHIGTDKLPRVIENMRNTIIGCGGEVHFETRMDALIIENDEVKGIETDTGRTFLGPVILATGHLHAMYTAGWQPTEWK